MTRSSFVHESVAALEVGADAAALGAAITTDLCGYWEHEGGCRWPHHTAVVDVRGNRVTIRTVFASDVSEAPTVRDRIHRALERGSIEVAGQATSRWRLVRDTPADLAEEEAPLAARLR